MSVFEEWRMRIYEDLEESRKFSSCVVVIRDDKFLILKRSKESDNFPDIWGLPGGGSEPDEDPVDCARRETYEESGLTLGVLDHIFTKVRNNFKNVYFFMCYDIKGEVELKKVKDEHTDFKWIELKDMDNYQLIPETEKIVRKAFGGAMV